MHTAEALISGRTKVMSTGCRKRMRDDVRPSCVEEVTFEFDERKIRERVWKQYGKGYFYDSYQFVLGMCEIVGASHGVRVSKRKVRNDLMDGHISVSRKGNVLKLHIRSTRTQLCKNHYRPMPRRDSKSFPVWAQESVAYSLATQTSRKRASAKRISATKTLIDSKATTGRQTTESILAKARRSRKARLPTTKKMAKVTLKECLVALEVLAGKPLRDCLSQRQLDAFRRMVRRNPKGAVGWLIEELLGIPHGSLLLDADDGEIKTATVDENGHVIDRVPITTAGIIPEVYDADVPFPFEETQCFLKLSRLLFVGIYHANSNDCGDWEIRNVRILDFTGDERLMPFLEEMSNDYDSAVIELLDWAEKGERIHSTGRWQRPILQTCQKDSGGEKNHPMRTKRYGTVSPVTYAWALTQSGMNRILDATND